MYNPATADAEATLLQGMPHAEQLFKLRMMCSTGRSMPLDMVSAHKWLTLLPCSGSRMPFACVTRSRQRCPIARSLRRNALPATG